MSFKGIIGNLKEVIITIGHALSRIFRKIIIIDHETLAFLSVVCIVTGSLIGLGVCRLSREDGRAGSFEELQGMIEELQTELTGVREELEVRDSEIEALNGSLTGLKQGRNPRL